MPVSRQDLFDYLDKLNIAHNTLDHDPIFRVEDSLELKAQRPGANTKNLFLKDKAGKFFLICAPVSYTHLRAHEDRTRSRMPSSA